MIKLKGTVTIDINEYNTLVKENKSLKDAIDNITNTKSNIVSLSYQFMLKCYHVNIRTYNNQDQKEEVLKLENKIKALEKDLEDVFCIENKFIIKLLRFFSKK